MLSKPERKLDEYELKIRSNFLKLAQNDPQLTKIHVCKNFSYPDNPLISLARKIKENTNLKELNISFNYDRDGVLAVIDSIHKSSKLELLDVRENNLDNNSISSIAKFIVRHPLLSLDLSINQAINNLSPIINTLNASKLKKLVIDQELTRETTEKLIKILSDNKTLKCLRINVGEVYIKDPALATSLINLLTTNKTLTEISLRPKNRALDQPCLSAFAPANPNPRKQEINHLLTKNACMSCFHVKSQNHYLLTPFLIFKDLPTELQRIIAFNMIALEIMGQKYGSDAQKNYFQKLLSQQQKNNESRQIERTK